MIGSLICRGLALIFGYAYPAYECCKTVELHKPEIEQLRFWCQYWILVAALTVCERSCDVLNGWVPMYGEAKLAFFICLWYPKTKLQHQVTTVPRSTSTNHISSPAKQAEDELTSSPAVSTSSSENQDMLEETEPLTSSKGASPRTGSREQKIATALTVGELRSVQSASVHPKESEDTQPEEIVLEGVLPVTRARSRKTRSVTSP